MESQNVWEPVTGNKQNEDTGGWADISRDYV